MSCMIRKFFKVSAFRAVHFLISSLWSFFSSNLVSLRFDAANLVGAKHGKRAEAYLFTCGVNAGMWISWSNFVLKSYK